MLLYLNAEHIYGTTRLMQTFSHGGGEPFSVYIALIKYFFIDVVRIYKETNSLFLGLPMKLSFLM